MDLASALDGDLRDWRGLPPQTTADDVRQAVGDASCEWDPAERVRITSRFRVLVCRRAAPLSVVEAWSRAGDDHIALVELDDPGFDATPLLDELGEPELALPSARTASGAVVEEHVFASRGLTLSVATPYDAEPADAEARRYVVRIQLYPATTPRYWVTDIGGGDELHPYPL